MSYSSRLDWCVLAGIVLAVAAVLLGANYWVAGPVLLILLLCAYPQTYETGDRALAVRDVLSRRQIPYATITSAGLDDGSVHIRYGLASELTISPADPRPFLADIERRTPHLVRRGDSLVLRDRHVEYSFARSRRVYAG
jgi:hypothetical protein